MATATITGRVTCVGKTFERTLTVTSDGETTMDPTVAAAKTGTLAVRTDSDTGTVTMTAGHGFATNDKIDLYWGSGATYGSRTHMTATVTVNSVVLDGGLGDPLPVATTAVTAMKPQNEEFSVTAANMVALFCGCPAGPATVTFLDGSNAVVATARITQGSDYDWNSANGVTTPFGSDVASANFSHNSSSASRQISAVALRN